MQRPETDTRTLREPGSADGWANDTMIRAGPVDLGAVPDADLTRVNRAVENGMVISLQRPETDTRTLRESGNAAGAGGKKKQISCC